MRSLFRIGPLFVGLILLLIMTGCDSSSSSRPAVKIGAPAPEFTLVNMNGEMVSLADFRGRIVVINFWATWCPPCREEKPTMEALYNRFKDEGLIFLALNVEENGHQVVSEYLMSHPYNFPILLDAKAVVQGLYGVFRYPESFVIDRNGVVVEHIIGGRDWMKNPTYRMIESLLQN